MVLKNLSPPRGAKPSIATHTPRRRVGLHSVAATRLYSDALRAISWTGGGISRVCSFRRTFFPEFRAGRGKTRNGATVAALCVNELEGRRKKPQRAQEAHKFLVPFVLFVVPVSLRCEFVHSFYERRFFLESTKYRRS